MKFSKDKKPTEAGWYWWIDSDTNRSEPIRVFDGLYGLVADTQNPLRQFSVPPSNAIWGDRIETPTVEAP